MSEQNQQILVPVFPKTEGQRPVIFGDFETSIAGTIIESALTGQPFIVEVEINGEIKDIILPIRKIGRNKLKPSPVVASNGEDVMYGHHLSLPGSVAKAMHLVEGLMGGGRDLNRYYTDAIAALWDEAGELVGSDALRACHPGLQAQADTLLTLSEGEAAMSMGMAITLSKETGIRIEEIVNRGLLMPAQRFPVAGPHGVRQITLRVNPRVYGKKIYFHPFDLKRLHQADTDGDLAYIAWIRKMLQFAVPADQKLADLPELPDLELVTEDRPGLRQLLATVVVDTDETIRIRKAMSQVLNAKVKDLTGRLTWLFWSLARGYAQAGRQKNLVKLAAYQRAFTLYEPLIEAVMDARKVEEFTVAALEAATVRTTNLALGIQAMMGQKPIDSEVAPGVTVADAIGGRGYFLSPKQVTQLSFLYRESGNLARSRNTVGGRLITGQKNLGFSTRKVVEALGEHGCPDGELWKRIQSCIQMDQVWSLPPGKPRKEQEATFVTIYPGGEPCTSFVQALESISYRGNKVFHDVKETEVDGLPALMFDLYPMWRAGEFAPLYRRMHILLPEVEGVSKYGHVLLHLAGESVSRFYRPALSKTPRGARFLSCYDSFRLAMKTMLLDWATEGRSGFKGAIQQGLNRCMLMWLHEQQPVRGEIDPMLKAEFTTYVPKPAGREVTEIWAEVEELLDVLLNYPEEVNTNSGFPEGTRFDPLATSKGSPFDVIALAGKAGRAIYGPYLNPFYRWLDPKRRTEVRELREAPSLKNAKLPSVKSAGCGLPSAYHGRVTEGWVAFMDLNYLVFNSPEGLWTFDTLGATEAAIELLAIEEEQFKCQDADALESMLARLARLGVTEDRITVEEEQALAGYLKREKGQELIGCPDDMGAIYRTTYLIRVKGDDRDEGKIKSLVSALKGVMTMLPCRIVAVLPWGAWQDIHITWSVKSAMKKRLGDAASYMVSGRKDEDGNVLLPEIDPNWTLEEFQDLAEGKLVEAGYILDGKLEILAIYPDGREVSLGRHFCGPLPLFRGPQTELHSANWRLGNDGVPFEPHGMILGEIPHPVGKDADRVKAEFDDIMAVIRANELELEKYPKPVATSYEDNSDEDFGPLPEEY